MNRNRTILQCFEWYLPEDGSFWSHVKEGAPSFSSLGITDVWLPPAYKGQAGVHDVGYGVYDLFDLGEFDQKGTVRTKYGTKEQYVEAVHALHDAHVKVLADIVLNHKMGADETEDVMAIECGSGDRNHDTSGAYMIKAWTKFTFPGRMGKYSSDQWNHRDFDGTDYDANNGRNAVFRFADKAWDSEVDHENGNYDYLMGCDLDMSNPEVQRKLLDWGKWYYDTTHFDGVRLDAVKHINCRFYTAWLQQMRAYTGKEMFAIGEYWNPDLGTLLRYIDSSEDDMSLFDVPLHFNLFNASNANGNYDMRRIFQDTLVCERPSQAVTFVDNHDTQPGQALCSFVQGWFKPLAYALILLTDAGVPCVFYGDLYGIPHDGIPAVKGLDLLLGSRRDHAYGKQVSYFDDFNVVGWIREGDAKHSGLAVVMSDGPGGVKPMKMPDTYIGKEMIDVMGYCPESVVIDDRGIGQFRCEGGAVSVWVLK